MKTRTLAIILIMVLTVFAAKAQKRHKVRQPEPSPEELARQEKLEHMTANTARVVFIDSFVVDKRAFHNSYTLNPEVGTISLVQESRPSRQRSDTYGFTNEIGNHRYMAKHDNDSCVSIYHSENIAGQWTAPTRLRGINDQGQFRRSNYPFMMGDGETFYFAAEGGDGLGGYDIYTSTYDKDAGRFLTPVNIGMPFNSEANDYMFVIDEYSRLGFFATDRRQPQDTVCVYVFVPSEIRQTYSPDEYTPEQIAAFSRIESISMTWDDSLQVSQAMARLQMTSDRKRQQVKGHDFTFVINDTTIYYHLSDFQNPGNVQRYRQLVSMRAQLAKLNQTLDNARQQYATSNEKKRIGLRRELADDERRQEELADSIRQLEKAIRNQEHQFLTKK